MRTDGPAQDSADFIADAEGFDTLDVQTQTDLLAWYLLNVLGRANFTAGELVELRLKLRLRAHGSLPNYLSNSLRAPRGQTPKYVRAERGYALERAYQAHLSTNYLGRPAARAIARDLRAELGKLADPKVVTYMTEAVECFEYKLFHAAVVFTWCVAYSQFRAWIVNKNLVAFNAVTATWGKPVTITSIDDFQELQEIQVIDAARKAKVISKEQQKTLKQLLDERNSYAHPSNKPISSSIAEAFVEKALREVVLPFK